MLSSVDLPEPDAPMIATNSPSSTSKSTSRSTGNGCPPRRYALWIPVSRSIASLECHDPRRVQFRRG